MASYEAAAGDIVSSLTGAGLGAATVAAITSLLEDLGGSSGDVKTATFDSGTITNQTIAAQAADAQVIMLSGDTNADLTFSANSPVQGIILGSGDNNVVFETAKDVAVVLQGGTDSVTTGAGNDTISIQGGSATVNTGSGDDLVAISSGDATIQSGNGDLTVDIARDATGAATINAGTGFDIVKMIDNVVNHTFSFVGGRFQMHSDMELSMDGINVIGFDSTGDGLLNSATVLATNQADSLIARLYSVVRGDDGVLDQDTPAGTVKTSEFQLDGIKFWLENSGGDLQHTVYSFLNSEEFHSKFDSMDNLQYVTTLFENLGLNVNDTVGGMSLAELANACGNEYGRYDVAWTIAASTEATDVLGANGEKYVIDAPTVDFDGGPLA